MHENDIDWAALPYPAKIDNLGGLAILEDLDVLGAEIADRLARLVRQSEIKLDAAVGIEMRETGITDRQLERGGCPPHAGGKDERSGAQNCERRRTKVLHSSLL